MLPIMTTSTPPGVRARTIPEDGRGLLELLRQALRASRKLWWLASSSNVPCSRLPPTCATALAPTRTSAAVRADRDAGGGSELSSCDEDGSEAIRLLRVLPNGDGARTFRGDTRGGEVLPAPESSARTHSWRDPVAGNALAAALTDLDNGRRCRMGLLAASSFTASP